MWPTYEPNYTQSIAAKWLRNLSQEGPYLSPSFYRGGVGDPESDLPRSIPHPLGTGPQLWSMPCWLRAASRATKASECSPVAFFSIFSLEAWSLSLIIQLLRVLKLFNRGLGHWVPVLSSSSHSWASADGKWYLTIPSFCPAVWISISSPQTDHTLSLLGTLHMWFSLPWISFFMLIIPVYPSGPGETLLYLESFPLSQSVLAQPLWFLYFFVPHATCNLLVSCLRSMNEARSWPVLSTIVSQELSIGSGTFVFKKEIKKN